jgi:Spy/CpxP family protein refolding chaperone
MKRALILAVATVSLAMSAAMQAQNPPNPPQGPPPMHPPMMGMGPMLHPGFWKDSEIVAKLKLSDAQRTQLEKIFSDHRSNLRATHEQLKAAMDAVRQTLGTDPVDEAAYNANVTKLLSLHSQIAQDFAAMTLAFRKVLTVDQWKTLEQTEQQHVQEFKMDHKMHHEGHLGGSGQQPPPEPPQ